MVMTVTMFTMERCRSKWLMVISWLEELNLEDNSCLHSNNIEDGHEATNEASCSKMVRMETIGAHIKGERCLSARSTS